MTDKVQKIKDWISCQQDSLIDANGNFQHSEDEAVYHTLCNLDAYIDFLQEEPVSEGKDIFDNCLKSEEKFILPQKISSNINCENCLYSSACALGDIQACIIDKPVSEELEEASKEWLKPQLDKSYADYGETKMMELTRFDGYAMLDAIEFGVQWQKEQDKETIELAEDHTMLAGMEKMKEQMMAKAVDVTVTDIREYKEENEVDFTLMLEKGTIPYELEEEIKVIVIKED